MDIIFIRELRLDTVIGLYPWERHIRQTVLLDLELATDVRRSAALDALDGLPDYDQVARRLASYTGEAHWHTVEALAEACATLLLDEFNLPWLRLTLTKPGALHQAKGVGVRIERQRVAA